MVMPNSSHNSSRNNCISSLVRMKTSKAYSDADLKDRLTIYHTDCRRYDQAQKVASATSLEKRIFAFQKMTKYVILLCVLHKKSTYCSREVR